MQLQSGDRHVNSTLQEEGGAVAVKRTITSTESQDLHSAILVSEKFQILRRGQGGAEAYTPIH